jgi:hypothetical protein
MISLEWQLLAVGALGLAAFLCQDIPMMMQLSFQG